MTHIIFLNHAAGTLPVFDFILHISVAVSLYFNEAVWNSTKLLFWIFRKPKSIAKLQYFDWNRSEFVTVKILQDRHCWWVWEMLMCRTAMKQFVLWRWTKTFMSTAITVRWASCLITQPNQDSISYQQLGVVRKWRSYRAYTHQLYWLWYHSPEFLYSF